MEKRIIKFKAKRLDNGEWVEGDLYHINNETYITWQDDGGYRFISKVDPSTVCQYTGLEDKKGNEIWEHDLIQLAHDEYEVVFYGGAFCVGFEAPSPLHGLRVIGKEFVNFVCLGSKYDK